MGSNETQFRARYVEIQKLKPSFENNEKAKLFFIPALLKIDVVSSLFQVQVLFLVVASHAAVARSTPAEVALIYTMHEALREYCP